MRKFKQRMGPEVDLDNPKTYNHLPNTTRELDDLMLQKIGYVLVYMDYLPDRKNIYPTKKLKKDKRWGYCGYEQRKRVLKLIKKFANNRGKKWNDVKWLREQVFMFEDETENMC